MSSPEPTQPVRPKVSALFGVSRTRIKALDEGLQKTLANAIQRWTEKRIEFIESLPDQTKDELDEVGMLQAPTVQLPNAAPAAKTAPAPSRHATAHAAPAPRSRL